MPWNDSDDDAKWCELCEAPATVETSRGDYCADCAAEYSGGSDYADRMSERRAMGFDF